MIPPLSVWGAPADAVWSPEPYNAVATRKAQVKNAMTRSNITPTGVLKEQELCEKKVQSVRINANSYTATSRPLVKVNKMCTPINAEYSIYPLKSFLLKLIERPDSGKHISISQKIIFYYKYSADACSVLSDGLVSIESDLYECFVTVSAASELVAEEHSPELAVLVLDVVLHGRLTGSAQLVGLLHVVLVHLNLLIIVLLGQGNQNRIVVFVMTTLTLHKLTVDHTHCSFPQIKQ